MTPPAAVLFDLFDTLVRCDWSDQAKLIASHLDVDEAMVTDANDQTRIHRDGGDFQNEADTLAAVARICGRKLPDAALGDLMREEALLLSQIAHLYDDSIPVLDGLRSAGVATAIVSNCSPNAVPIVERLDLSNHVDLVMLSFEVGSTKPDPVIFEVALTRLGVSPDRSWFVDDRADYLDGAARLGMTTFRIHRADSHGEQMAGSLDHAEIGGLTELLGLVQGG